MKNHQQMSEYDLFKHIVLAFKRKGVVKMLQKDIKIGNFLQATPLTACLLCFKKKSLLDSSNLCMYYHMPICFHNTMIGNVKNISGVQVCRKCYGRTSQVEQCNLFNSFVVGNKRRQSKDSFKRTVQLITIILHIHEFK